MMRPREAVKFTRSEKAEDVMSPAVFAFTRQGKHAQRPGRKAPRPGQARREHDLRSGRISGILDAASEIYLLGGCYETQY